MLRAQRTVPRLSARVQRGLVAAAGRKRFVDWSFDHYLEIAHPRYGDKYARVPERRSAAATPVAA